MAKDNRKGGKQKHGSKGSFRYQRSIDRNKTKK